METQTTQIESGYCHCGCGGKTKIAPYSSKRISWIKGNPIKYIHGHNAPFRGYVASEKTKKKISKTISKLFSDPTKSPTWKGGIIKRDGYFYIMEKGNGNGDKYGYVKKCNLPAQKVLGRELKIREVVHHINGKRDDDRNCNLLICSDSYHKYLHGKIRGGFNYGSISANNN